MRPEDLIFDPLVLPLSTGMEESRRDGIETIEAIRRIKAELPGVHTTAAPYSRASVRKRSRRVPGASPSSRLTELRIALPPSHCRSR